MSTWFQIVITALVGIFGTYLTWLSYKRNKAELFHKLFTEFNARYNKLNNKLYQIINSEKEIKSLEGKTLDGLKMDYRNVAIDYFNLCAEEYLWNKKGYIDDDVWKAWQTGIMWWYNNSQIIRMVWAEEKDNSESYYLKHGESFL
jgi:hypothetical protein